MNLSTDSSSAAAAAARTSLLPRKSRDKSIVEAMEARPSKASLTSCRSHFQREAKISKMFLTIFLLFLFGYMPYSIIRMLDKRNSLHPDVYVLLTVWFVMTSTISPLIVIQMNRQIRSRCKKLLRNLLGKARAKEGAMPKCIVASRNSNKTPQVTIHVSVCE